MQVKRQSWINMEGLRLEEIEKRKQNDYNWGGGR